MYPIYNKSVITKNSVFLILGISVILSGCGIFDSDDKTDEEKVAYTIYNNINDPLLLSAVTADGDSLAYFGERNEQGIPERVTGATVQMKNKLIKTATEEHFIENEAVEIVNNGLQNMPSKIVTDDFTFLFEWQSRTDVIVTTIENDGQHRTQIALDLNNLDQELPKNLFSDKNFTQRKSLNNLDQKSPPVADFQCSNGPNELGPVYSSSATSNIIISVDRCGSALAGAQVGLAIGQKGMPSKFLNASPSSGGDNQYLVSIPVVDETMGEKIDKACNDVVGTVGIGCNVSKELSAGSAAICAKIALYSGPLAAKVGTACLVGITGYAYYCSIANWSPEGLVPGAEWTSPAQFICSSIGNVVDRGIDYFGEDLQYTVNISHESLNAKKAEGYYPNIKTSPASGPYPNIYINMEGEPEITQLRADPPNPAEGQDYMVLVSLTCASQANLLGINVVGSDGYSDSKTCSSLEAGNKIDCYLTVPGAEGGVKDAITITLNGVEINNLTVVFRGGAEKMSSLANSERTR